MSATSQLGVGFIVQGKEKGLLSDGRVRGGC